MNINIDNCYTSLSNKMNEISDCLEPLQKDNYAIRMALTNARFMYVTATNVLDAYKELKEK